MSLGIFKTFQTSSTFPHIHSAPLAACIWRRHRVSIDGRSFKNYFTFQLHLHLPWHTFPVQTDRSGRHQTWQLCLILLTQTTWRNSRNSGHRAHLHPFQTIDCWRPSGHLWICKHQWSQSSGKQRLRSKSRAQNGRISIQVSEWDWLLVRRNVGYVWIKDGCFFSSSDSHLYNLRV